MQSIYITNFFFTQFIDFHSLTTITSSVLIINPSIYHIPFAREAMNRGTDYFCFLKNDSLNLAQFLVAVKLLVTPSFLPNFFLMSHSIDFLQLMKNPMLFICIESVHTYIQCTVLNCLLST